VSIKTNNINLIINGSSNKTIVQQRKIVVKEEVMPESDFENKLSVLALEMLTNVKNQYLFLS